MAGVVRKSMKRANVPLGTKPATTARNLAILEPFAETTVTCAVVKIMKGANVPITFLILAHTLLRSVVLFAVVKSMKKANVLLPTRPAENA